MSRHSPTGKSGFAPAVRLLFMGVIFDSSGEVGAVLVHVTTSEGRVALEVSPK